MEMHSFPYLLRLKYAYNTKQIHIDRHLSIIATILLPLTGCFTIDKYHNKKHIDTFEKNMDLVHKDIDRVLSVDVPSPLVEGK
ncbi:MAG TPA: hypothetical protein ACFYEC_02215 [Candidatus Brocadiaceae bacterium]